MRLSVPVPLWVRLAFAMAILAVAPVVVVGFSAMKIATDSAEKDSVERLRREAVLHAEIVGRWINQQAALVLVGGTSWGDRLKTLPPEAQAGLPRLVYRLVPSAVTVVLVDGRGKLVAEPAYLAVSDGQRIPSGPERARELVARLPLEAAAAEPNVVHPGKAGLPDGPGSRPSVPLAVLAAGGDTPEEQRVLGVEVALDIDDYLQAFIHERHAVALLDAEGLELVGGGQSLIDPEQFRPLLGTDQVWEVTRADRPGVPRGALAPVGGMPGWTVAVVEPALVVLEPATRIREVMLPQLLFAAAIGVALALIVASSLSRPVERLRDASMRLADGDLSVRAAIRRSDEIGELGRAFDHLAERLEENRREIAAQQAEIEAFNAELQERVDERTRELRLAQEELVRSGQLAAVAELGAGLAHELNNPLASVLGLAQVLRRRLPQEALLAQLEQQADRCRDVVATMLRAQSLQVDPTDVPVVELSEVLRQARELLGGSFRQRGVLLEMNTGDLADDWRVRLDPVHGGRIVAQILNAVRAGLEPGATVRVSPGREGGAVVLELAADRAVASSADRRDDWLTTGHGLWVARQLLDRLGGRLDQLDGQPDGQDDKSGPRTWRVVLPGA
jgi:two-component system NtrC family sensor kinase